VARRIRLVVEYDGTDYAGWQRQANARTVQQTIEESLWQMVGGEPCVQAAGRTDAGVHALGQVAAFSTDSAIPLLGLQRGLNALLPRAIAVAAVDEVAPGFDPRRHALGKLYRYRIWNAEARSPTDDRYAWHRSRPLDDERMRAAAAPLVGEHDFRAFRAADCERKTTVRRITRLAVERRGALLAIEVEATAFLKNMVRILAGTLVEAGRGRLGPDEVAAALSTGERTRAGPTAPPHGLFLVRVDYDPPAPPPPHRYTV
jgi:tRNA pseudouridine38-40 synthase